MFLPSIPLYSQIFVPVVFHLDLCESRLSSYVEGAAFFGNVNLNRRGVVGKQIQHFKTVGFHLLIFSSSLISGVVCSCVLIPTAQG